MKEISVVIQGQVTIVVAITGQFNIDTAESLMKEVSLVFDNYLRADVQAIIVDMSLVELIDSTALSKLIALHQKFAPVVIRNLNPHLQDMFERIGLDKVFKIIA